MFIKGKALNNIKIKALLIENDEYEIYRTMKNGFILVVKTSLYTKWLKENILFNVDPFKKITIEQNDFYFLHSEKAFQLGIVKHGNPLSTRHSALTFTFVLKQMRKVTDISLYDGIYIEEFGYILPTYTSEKMSDDALLGSYISGGKIVHFSDENLKSLFLVEDDYEEISKLIGIEREKSRIRESKKAGQKGSQFRLIGRPELEKFFNEHIVNILNEPERYKKLGIDFPSSIVLYGPPGCGKTYAVDRLVEFLELPKFEVNSATVASPYIHDTSKKISAVFDSAIKSSPSVIVIDEMESYLSNRNNMNAGTHHFEEVAEFLRQIQEAQKNKVIVMAMTNMLDKIDPAILRRGRFDHQIEVGYPSKEEIISLLKSLLKKVSTSDDISPEQVATKLEGKSLADVTFVMKEAALISGKAGHDMITNSSIQEAILTLPKEKERKPIGFGN